MPPKKPSSIADIVDSLPPEVSVILGAVMMGLGKLGELAERFVVAHEKIAATIQTAGKDWSTRADALSGMADGLTNLGEAVRGLQGGFNDYRDYDRNRTG